MNLSDAIDLAIKNVQKEGITDVDVFSRPFEIDMLRIEDFKSSIKNMVKTNLGETQIKQMGFTTISHVLTPKKTLFDFRKSALIDPIDEIRYLSLALQVAENIENSRQPIKNKQVFSYRFQPENGFLFNQKYNYTNFREFVTAKTHSSKINVMIECDIANFYDRLNIHRLECILSSIPEINPKIVKQINELLLFWSNRDSYGLPVGSNASRILAEAALIEIDKFLESHKISYCRYVDDIRIFAPNIATAHHWLSLLVERLSKEGLFINTQKTHIRDVSNLKRNNLSHKTHSILSTIDVPSTEDEIAQNEKKKSLSQIITGYSGVIPTKFRKLTIQEEERLKNKKLDVKIVRTSFKNVIIDTKEFIRLTKQCIAQKNFACFLLICKSLEKIPQFIPYIVSAILKNHSIFTKKQLGEITATLSYWMDRSNTPEFISIYVARLLGSPSISEKEKLMNVFRNLKRNDGSYIGRVILEQLFPHIGRSEVVEIRDYFTRADPFERRIIARMVDAHLTQGEKRPFFKNALLQYNDPFMATIYDLKSKHGI